MKSRRGRPHGASQMDSAARASFALLPEVVSALQCRFRLARRGLGDVWALLVFKEPLTMQKFTGLGLVLVGVFFLGLGC